MSRSWKALLVFVLGVPTASAVAEPQGFVRVTVATANIRDGAGTKFQRLWQVRRHEPLQVIERDGEWLRVRDHDERQGWIFELLTDNRPAVVVEHVREWANVRSGPGQHHPVAFRADRGSSFVVLASEEQWLRVESADGEKGWLHRSLAWPPDAGPSRFVRVKVSSANIRQDPGTDSEILWTVPKNFPLTVVGREGEWLKTLDFEGIEGWIYAPLTDENLGVVVTADVGNVRAGPGLQHRIVSKVYWGESFGVRGQDGSWVAIEHEPGGRGWIHRDLVWGSVEKEG